MLNYFLVGAGGALGSIARVWCSSLIANRLGSSFPWGTLTVNVVGSLAIGFFAASTTTAGRWPLSLQSREFFMVGICGGYTTFSAFSLQTFELIRAAEYLKAAANALLSCAFCLAAVALGHWLAGLVNQSKLP